jgi:mannose-1-phosphate guanylyltransferase
MRYAVIMAGGAGKRLWPMSRLNFPKQLLRLVGGKSLMEMAVDRLDGVFEPEEIFVVTNAEYAQQVRDVLREIPPENVIGEPQGRDTANAVALAAEVLSGKNAQATMAVFTADHIIKPTDCFQQAVRQAMDAAEEDPEAFLTFGVRPTWPHTGLGYIEVADPEAPTVHRVASFKEKPDHTAARQYVESGRFYWNSGMFVWKVPAILDAIGQYMPDTAEKLAPVRERVARGEDYCGMLEEVYPTLEKISVDYAIMEKAPKVRMVELQCEWVDLGSWPALDDAIEPDQQGNSIVAENHVIMDSFHNVLVSSEGHLLAVMGMDDCIIVHSPDATLVCKKSDHQRMKELVSAIEKHYGRKFI